MNDSCELHEAAQRAVKAHLPRLVRAAYAVLGNMADAEDVAQDTFVSYLQQPGPIADPEREKAWLLRVCINKSRNVLKSGWRRKTRPLDEQLAVMPPEDAGVLEAVLSLEEKYRLPLHLFYYENYAISEIAALLRLPVGTVGTRLDRGRKQLKEKLGGAENA